ncbi:hypothetical protein GTW49_04330 [Streptomyces sp. SID4925]|nr:hypothetical protein [Streptomyces sp. SID4925]
MRGGCRCAGPVPLSAPSRNRGSAPDPAPQAPEGLEWVAPCVWTPLLKRRRGWGGRLVRLGPAPQASEGLEWVAPCVWTPLRACRRPGRDCGSGRASGWVRRGSCGGGT